MTVVPIVIAPAVREDLPFIAECRYGMFVEMHPEKDFGARREQFLLSCRTYFRDHFADKDMALLIARSGADCVGCGVIVFQDRPPHIEHPENRSAYILNIFVVREFRKRGIATRMVRALMEEAGRRGVRRIGLHASAAGLPVYLKLGYAIKENYLEFTLT
jgi:ribosomal protein S18 acetylase RimI-like enzyme